MEFQDNDDRRPTWEEIDRRLPELEEHKPDLPEIQEGPLPHGITPGDVERIIVEIGRKPNPNDFKWKPSQKD